MSDSRHYAAMPSGHRTPVDEQRDPTVVASGLLVGLLMLGLVGGLASIMGAHLGLRHRLRSDGCGQRNRALVGSPPLPVGGVHPPRGSYLG